MMRHRTNCLCITNVLPSFCLQIERPGALGQVALPKVLPAFCRQIKLVGRMLLAAGILLMATIPGVSDTARDAAVMFNAYSNVFYVSNGTNAWFKADQTGGVADFWEQAEEIECMIDAEERSPSAGGREMITRLLDGFVRNNRADWSANKYNDDCMWACIAFARGYLVTGESRFKAIALHNFDRVYSRAWDQVLGGGLYWTTANNTKNACVNGPAGIAAWLLYRIDQNEAYLVKAREIYAWERSVLFDPRTGAVSDAKDIKGNLHSWASTYNQGTFIGLANDLGQTNDATRAADFTWEHLADSGVLLPYGAGGNNSGFNAIFIRWLACFMKEHGSQADYQKCLQTNALAAWSIRRASDNLSWCQWRQPTPAGSNLRSWDCIASLEALELAPTTDRAQD